MKFSPLKDTIFNIGLALVLLSSLIFVLTLNIEGDGSLGIFFLNYLWTAGYWLAIFITAIFFRRTFRFFRLFPALILSLISAYTLNRSMNIFDASPVWFTVMLVGTSVTYLSLAYFNQMSRIIKYLVIAIMGISTMVYIYLTIYLLPLYPFSLAFFWLLGLSLHSFVPLLFLIFTSIWLYRTFVEDKRLSISYGAGILFSVLVITTFTVRWAHTVNVMNDTYRETFIEDDVTLPAWVRVAQRIPVNSITNKALKVDLTYIIPDIYSINFFDFNFPSRFTEKKLHDPLVVIASVMGGRPSLNVEEKVKILESIYDSRHQATERLWSDAGVKTTYINSSILIWPQYRMSYTEQVIMIGNSRDSWRPGEAVYTFHLPEGSVVTSLSLWINGNEEKGILTTKAKADSAYRTIVGVESRDPSLVHWQEGSTVSVRVFPVTRDEERTFKIGITSPLHKDGQKLAYHPVYFDGTDFSKAKETITVRFMQEPKQPEYPSFMERNTTGLESKNKSRYNNHWSITMDDVPLSTDPFCFDQHCYSVQDVRLSDLPASIENIYLDINNSWTTNEFNAVYELAGNKKAWIYDGQEIIALNNDNKDYIFKILKNQQFSLFPIHKISNPAQSLLISKSTSVSPNISDLKDSRFMQGLKAYARPEQAVFFLDMGKELSPYLKTLREYRLLKYKQGNIQDLQDILQKSVFQYAGSENDSCIVIHDADICILKKQELSNANTNAPDHLMRLFAYNHIMQQYAQSWNSRSPVTDQMVAEAQQAYVVSPVSSLVVLESQRDYDRFDIKDTENSLKNASKSSKGAVPEPHEWALLMIAGMVAVYLYYRRK